MKKFKTGYTQGAFDCFHVGHLNLIRRAKRQCEYLIVGVNSNALIRSYKHKVPVENMSERKSVVSAIRYVDRVVSCSSLDKLEAWEAYRFDAVFIGDDWKGSERWLHTEEQLRPLGVSVVYLPYTRGVSTTKIRNDLGK